MRITVDDSEISITEISYNDGLNYGRFNVNGIEVFPYEYSIDKSKFILLMSDQYEQCLNDIKLDDQNCNDTSAFSEMDYADINEAFNHPKALGEAIETYFDRALFHKTLGAYKAQPFIINSTDRVEISEGKIKIYGRCFRRRYR